MKNEENSHLPKDSVVFRRVGKRFWKECFVDEVDALNLSLDGLAENMKLVLRREKTDRYDAKAVSIVLVDRGQDDLNKFDSVIGYIPRDENSLFAKLLDDGFEFKCKIVDINQNRSIGKRIRIATYICSKYDMFEELDLLRVMELNGGKKNKLINELAEYGFVYFRFREVIIDEGEQVDLPKKGDTVVFFYLEGDKAILYFMTTIAVREDEVYRYVGHDFVSYIDGCGPYIFTNIKTPIIVDLKSIDFLKNENLDSIRPSSYVSEYASEQLWDIFDRNGQVYRPQFLFND